MDPNALIPWIPQMWLAVKGGEVAADFFKRVLGPVGDEMGKDLAGWYQERGQRSKKVIEDAAAMVKDAGLEAGPVPGRLLLPLMQYASLEDEPDLQRKWSALLANAAVAGPSDKILPAYVEILRQLTPAQANILQWMYNQKQQYDTLPPMWPDIERDVVEHQFALSHAEYALLITDMERLLVIQPRRELDTDQYGEKLALDRKVSMIVHHINERVRYEKISFTALGLQFIRACTPPLQVVDRQV